MELPPSEYRKHSLQQETRGKYHKLRTAETREVLVVLLLLREVLSTKQLQSNGKLTKGTEAACLETESVPTRF